VVTVDGTELSVLIGGIANPALRRVVRYGDGWLAVALDAIRMKERLSTLKQLCESSGRVFDDLDLVYKIFINPAEAKKGPFGEREIGSGSEQQIIDDLKSILGAGFSSVIVRYRGDSAEAQQLQMERFVEKIIPSL
jgi:alkanesulfonate monooxygenase SsuD/methylene tetrahydromethanopterin reductase-like flavin-dependent oxidoreductase (luciferase family)